MTGAPPFYVTTPIYYVNDVPHLGTAYTTIAADALRRHAALRGRQTRMLTGTDEHGLKIERAAAEQSISPQAFADQVSQAFREAWPELRVEADDFIRTTEPRHIEFVQALWTKIAERGFIYEGSYDDWYCVGCESFKTEKELLPGNVCPVHQKPVERLQEETYFFKLSAFQDQLLALYARRPDFIRPETRKNEVISFVAGGLKDLSVSRTSFKWGIPVPGDDKHVMYVWFDALSNYLSALGDKQDTFWPPHGEALHIVGKDILRFHTVYWPAFLLAAGYGEEALPTSVYAHGFLTVDGMKMSKSLRNAVDPRKLAKVLGADALRYHLLRAVSFGQDGDFSHEALLERYNADLGKNLGNLLQRTLGLCTKFFDGNVPPLGEDGALETQLAIDVEAELAKAGNAWARHEPHAGLEATFAVSSLLNTYIDRAAPWTTAKTQLAYAGHTLHTILRELARLSRWIWPAVPDKADAMRAALGLGPVVPSLDTDLLASREVLTPGAALAPGAPLFPTYDRERMEAVLSELKPVKVDEEPLRASEEPPPTIRRAVEPPPPAPEPGPIAYDEFAKVDLRAGLIVAAERVPRKDKLLKLSVDVGEETPRQIVAGLALTFAPDELVGRRVVVVANLAPRDFGKGLVSHGMLLASGPSEALHLATVPEAVSPGSKLK